MSGGVTTRGPVAEYATHGVQGNAGLELWQPPGRPGIGPGQRINSQRQSDREVVRRRRVRPELGDDVDRLGELIRMFEVGRDVAVESRGPTHRLDLAGEAAGPDRHAGPLDRARQESHVVDGVVLAPMLHRLPGPSGRQDLERLVEHPAPSPVVQLLAGLGQLAAEPIAPDAHAEREPAIAELVERDGLASQLRRSPAWDRRDHRPKAYSLGAAR